MKKLIAATIISTIPCTVLLAGQKPNIILFLVDDMGWQDTSVPFDKQKSAFNALYETPAMERLAQKGMKFTSAYAAPVSSPSRVSLISGSNAARHGVTNWTLYKDQQTDGNNKTLMSPNWNYNGVTTDRNLNNAFYADMFPQILKDNGYYNIFIGKAHFGAKDTPAEDPLNIGFHKNIAGHAAGGLASYLGDKNFGNISDKSKQSVFAVPGLDKYHGKNIFVTEALTQEACLQIDTALMQNKPFFMYFGHYAIHVPLDKDDRFYQKYIDKGMTDNEARYAALIEGMDKSLGDMMDYLEKKKLDKNTIILFMSDNGGLSATGRSGTKHTHNAPLRSGKGSVYEGGIREPMIVYWPGVTKPNSVTDAPIIMEDYFPTILQMAGVKRYTTTQTVDGNSFVNILKGGKADYKRSLVWHYPNDWGVNGPGINMHSALRKGKWKLVYSYEREECELYNIYEDISESRNLALEEEYAPIAKSLQDELFLLLKQRNAFMPTKK